MSDQITTFRHTVFFDVTAGESCSTEEYLSNAQHFIQINGVELYPVERIVEDRDFNRPTQLVKGQDYRVTASWDLTPEQYAIASGKPLP